MATASVAPSRARPRPYRLSVDQYLRMIAAGVFPPEVRVELLGGLLVEPMTKNAPHNYSSRQLGIVLRACLPDPYLVSEEKSLVIGKRWRPEPDLVVVQGPNSRYRARDPEPADVALLIEVADSSSYAIDRGAKYRRYAAARIPAYWIVDLNDRRVEVFAQPTGRGRSAGYRTTEVFDAVGIVPVIVGGSEVGRVVVGDLLP